MQRPVLAPTVAVAIQYFLYFCVMGMVLPFFNLYCYHLGFSGAEIGALSGIRSLTLVVFSLMWGTAADRMRSRWGIFVGCSAASAGLWALFLVRTDFVAMTIIMAVYGIFYSPLISFLEAFAMDVLDRDKNRYGSLRAWGSISFIVTVLALGRIIDRTSVAIIVGLVLAVSLVQAAMAATLPHTAPQTPAVRVGDLRRLFTPRLVAFLFSAFLMLASHGAYYAFFSIHLESLGFDKSFIGLCWALASTAEIVVMLNSRRLFERFSLQAVLGSAFGIAALRWGLLFVVRSGPGILFSQILHAATYGAFHMASILYIDRSAPPAAKTVGQAANNAVTYGLGLMTGFFVSGIFYKSLGAPGLFAASGGIAVIGGLCFLLGHRLPASYDSDLTVS